MATTTVVERVYVYAAVEGRPTSPLATDGVPDGSPPRAVDLDQALLLVGRAHRDGAHDEAGAQARADRRRVVLEELDHAGADVAQAEQRDPDLAFAGGAHHGTGAYE